MLTAPTTALAARWSRVRHEIDALGLDALVVTHLPNVAYLTNFVGTMGIALVGADRLYLLTDFRYAAAVQDLLALSSAPADVEFVRVDGSYDESLASTLERSGARVAGFESASLPWKRVEWWRARLGATVVASGQGPVPASGRALVATDGVVELVRMRKDEHEVAVFREAAARLSDVARGVLSEVVRAGRTEADAAAEIDWRLKRAGFSRPAFDTIVASGPNSAHPHAHPTSRIVGDGELVVLDFGGVFEGYCVDLTRTVATGEVGPEARRLYGAVREAQRRAITASRAGVATDLVDAAARDCLAGLGLGDAFGHGTGHGLGLEIHEEPRIGRRRTEGPAPASLEAGVVCTIEPGVYVPGIGGVRLEDDILVTDGGCDVLTQVPFDGRLDE
jgi:Xaa-Pro aminopeptidase